MTRLLDEETRLEARGDGRYVRPLEKGPFWGVVTAHGGYLMALALHAMEREVADASRAPRMLSHQFLGSTAEGEVAIDVVVERVGRTVTSASARLYSIASGEGAARSAADQASPLGERLVGMTTAIFAEEGEGPSFLDDVMPQVAPPKEADREMLGFFLANVHNEFDFHRRFGEDGAVVPCEDGGWIISKDEGPWDHRDALVASDAWVPPVIRHPDRLVATPSLHHVAHFGPDVRGAETIPFLVHHKLSSGGSGVTDEDISLWAEDGRLLMKAKQLRAVVPPQRAVGQDLAREHTENA